MIEKRNLLIYAPTQGAETWQQFLAEPDKQWRTGYSARTMAYCWESATDFPDEIKSVLMTVSEFQELELLLAIPEHKVALPPYHAAASQNDLFVLAKSMSSGDLVSMTVEGKVAEPFGQTVEEWSRNLSPGKQERLDYLKRELGITLERNSGIRYQLLHRTVSAILEARRFNAKYAVMLVHSFSPSHEWFADYRAFLELYDVQAERNKLYFLRDCDGIGLYSGWASGNTDFLLA